jgi:hypothetical protein
MHDCHFSNHHFVLPICAQHQIGNLGSGIDDIQAQGVHQRSRSPMLRKLWMEEADEGRNLFAYP